jgi:hypothetical protein
MNKKFLIISISLLMLTLLFPITARADSPGPPLSVNIDIQNPPGNAAYYDLLVPESLSGIKPGQINPIFLALHPEFIDSELAKYNTNSFVSYTMYFQPDDADFYLKFSADFPQIKKMDPSEYDSQSKSPKYDYVSFKETNYYAVTQFAIAAIDSEGNIIKISPLFNTDKVKIGMVTGFTYDYQQNSIQIDTINSDGFFLYLTIILLGGFRIGYSVLIEMLIALPFKIRPLSLVAILNVLSEIVLTVGMFLFSVFGASYVQSLVVFEALVVLIEFLGFLKFTKNIPTGRIAVYVFIANAASLTFGLCLNTYHLNF